MGCRDKGIKGIKESAFVAMTQFSFFYFYLWKQKNGLNKGVFGFLSYI